MSGKSDRKSGPGTPASGKKSPIPLSASGVALRSKPDSSAPSARVKPEGPAIQRKSSASPLDRSRRTSAGSAEAEPSPRGYHHGNLREELIAAALSDLESHGAHELSLRDIAARLGVSKTAPYRHFADKPALLSALVAEGFRRLADRMEAVLSAPYSPLEAVRHMGREYVDFAAERPGLYRLMFSAEGFHLSSEACRVAGDRALGSLHAAVSGAQAAGWRAGEEAGQLTLMLWAYVHGVAGLRLEGLLPPVPEDDPATWHRLAEGFVSPA